MVKSFRADTDKSANSSSNVIHDWRLGNLSYTDFNGSIDLTRYELHAPHAFALRVVYCGFFVPPRGVQDDSLPCIT